MIFEKWRKLVYLIDYGVNDFLKLRLIFIFYKDKINFVTNTFLLL